MTRFSRAASIVVLALVTATSPADAARKARGVPVPAPPPAANSVETIVITSVPLALLKAAWTQYGPRGLLEARAVVEGSYCPVMAVDLRRVEMRPRAAKDSKFLTTCAAVIPPGTKQAALVFPQFQAGLLNSGDIPVDLVPLPLPVAEPQRILVLGDTGCRIKGKALQDCSDPEAWPFARVAAQAAKLRPDLVIHVGDYLYRENACPADFKGCTGTPFGDNWPTWDADFFAPAKPLLAAAPWVIVRGNHEDCQRAGPGFLRLLGATPFDPNAACSDHLPQYAIPLEHMTLVVEDNADAPETSVVDKAVPVYKEEIAALSTEKAPVWWLQHRPIWGVISGPLGLPVGGNLTMMAALGPSGIPAAVELMLAGHIHSFEAINYDPDNHVPPQIVAGQGGDELDATPANLHGAIFQGSSGVSIKDGISIGGFGFLLMTRTDDGWSVDAYDPHGRIVRQCVFRASRLDCPARRR